MKPKYKHDCNHCIFLGHVIINDRNADIYVCEQGFLHESSLIWRHSDEESDYGSTSVDMVSPLCLFAPIALALYIKYLGANGANGLFKGEFFKYGKSVLKIN